MPFSVSCQKLTFALVSAGMQGTSALESFYVFSMVLTVAVLILSWALVEPIRRFVVGKKIIDDPASAAHRKHQTTAVPLLCGMAFVIASSLGMLLVVAASYFGWFDCNLFISEQNWARKILAVLIGIAILSVGGLLDDMQLMRPSQQTLVVLAAVGIVVFGGGIHIVDFPLLGNSMWVNQLVTCIWLAACTAATKFLDGHDGLVPSVGVIGLLGIASVSLFDVVQEPLIALFALIWVAGIIGFIPANFPHAKVYMGEAASYVVGFMIGTLSILSESKLVTGSTVIGYFIFDLIVVWVLRLRDGRNPLTSGDRLHWHHRLLDIGLDKLQVLVFTVLIILFSTHLNLWFHSSLDWYILLLQPVLLGAIFLLLGHKKRTKPVLD
jgi:UDP-GlcNAc:undecaprenyl-phosphate/decaprenyl-phosphate GlcNAc-1-phosphate transferase